MVLGTSLKFLGQVLQCRKHLDLTQKTIMFSLPGLTNLRIDTLLSIELQTSQVLVSFPYKIYD